MVRLVALAALSFAVACGGLIDPASTGEDEGGLAKGRASSSSGAPPAPPSAPSTPPSDPANDLDDFQECSGTHCVLVSDDPAVSAAAGEASGTGEVLGTVRHRTGKYYFEISVTSLNGGLRIGLDGILNGATSRCTVSNDQTMSCTFAAADGMSGGGGGGPTQGPFFASSYVGVAVDLDQQLLHYFRDGEPIADASFSFTVDEPPLLMAPLLVLDDAAVQASFSGAFHYPAPDGYSPWDCAF